MSTNPAAVPSTALAVPSVRMPLAKTLENAAKIAIDEDRPIMMDYWADSINKKAMIVIQENNEKFLVKSDDEYTSPIAEIKKWMTDFIIKTQHSIYIVSSDIAVKKV